MKSIHSLLPLLLACAALGQNIDTLPAILGSAVDKANDKLLIRDASVSAAAGALRSMELDELVNVPGMFSSLEPALGNPAANGYLLSSTTAGVRSWVAPASGGTWGSITGTLASQTDLSNALEAKVDDSQVTLTGGVSKILQTDAAGNLNLGTIQPAGGIAAMGRSLLIPSTSAPNNGLTRLWFLNAGGTDGASILYYPEHSGNAELQINGDRIALCSGSTWGMYQLGLQIADSKQTVYLQRRGIATGANPLITSIPLMFTNEYWTGSARADAKPWAIYGVPAGGSDASSLKIYQLAAVPPESSTPETKTEIASFDADGLSGATSIVTRATGDTRYKSLASSLSADTAGVTASTTKVDSGLEVALVAGTTYRIEMMLSVSHSSAGGMRLKGLYSGTLALLGGSLQRDVGAGTNTSAFAASVGLDIIAAEYAYGTSTVAVFRTTGIYTATTSGTLKLQYAQNVSDATASIIKKGSYLIASPL